MSKLDTLQKKNTNDEKTIRQLKTTINDLERQLSTKKEHKETTTTRIRIRIKMMIMIR